jgi:hypothetical protein
MSGSSDSSGGKTASSMEVEDLKRIVRELGHLDQARAGDHENTPLNIIIANKNQYFFAICIMMNDGKEWG